MLDELARVSALDFGYRRRPVIERLSLTLAPGVTALLGPNGAGKSTLLALLSTRLLPRAGKLTVLGHDVADIAGRDQIRRNIGYLAQRYPMVGSLRVEDTVAYAAWAHGLPRRRCYEAAHRALVGAEIESLSSRRVRSLSGGQRQRVGIACAMVTQPAVLMLDEPTAGLDPEARLHLRQTLRSLTPSTSIVLATHMLEDALTMCDDIVMLHRGHLVFQGPARALELAATEAADERQHRDDGMREREGSRLERGYAELLRRSSLRDP